MTEAGDALHQPGCATTGAPPCTLRDAITFANARPGADTIAFAVGTGAVTIAPSSPLPPITEPVTLDGSTQPGATGGPSVVLDGSGAGVDAPGLVVRAGGSIVRGLAVVGFRSASGAAVAFLEKGGNRLEGCWIGLSPAGGRGNRGVGVLVRSDRNVLGGPRRGARNVVSANGVAGIRLEGTDNAVEGNLVGTDPSGARAAGNGGDGIASSGTNRIGGLEPGAGNVVSGNRGFGIAASPGDAVLGNFVGTDAAGRARLPNAKGGISGGGRIGGTAGAKPEGPCTGACNLVSGNGGPGISPGPRAVVEGNFVGTNAAGDTQLANEGPGVFVSAVAQARIGGEDKAHGNLLSGNSGAGVEIAFDAEGTVVAGNRIGVDAKGTAPLPNAEGVRVRDGARRTRVGGDATPEGNRIAFNAGAGVLRDASAGDGVAILSNEISANRALGIDWYGDGVTANRAPGGETTADAPPAYPVLGRVTPYAVEGTLDGAPDASYILQVFSNGVCDPSGHGQGETLIATTTVATDDTGHATFGVSLTAPPGQPVTATATDAAGNTSEFSACATPAASE